MKKLLLAGAAAVLILTAPAGKILASEQGQEVEHFILPETPPTIERVKKPPLDQPFLRKQDFETEFDLSPAPVLVGLNFHRFQEEESPVTAEGYEGSFATRGGGFVYSSTKSVDVSYSLSSTEGEYPNLARQKSSFDLRFNKDISGDKYYFAGARSRDIGLWLQDKRLYGFDSGYGWYARDNLTAKITVSYDKGEVKGQESNESAAGSLSLLWEPFEGQSANLQLNPQRDTSIGGTSEFDLASLRYDVMLFSNAVLGAGGRYTKDKVFPQGYLALGLAPGLKLSVNYLPGIEKIDWNRLYVNDDHVQVNKDLLYPESEYDFTENISFYLNEENSVEFELSQAQWKNYLFWESLPGTGLIAPGNEPDAYAACGRLKTVFGTRRLSLKLSGEHNLNDDQPFVPEYRFSGNVVCLLGTWSFGTGYDHTGPVRFLRNGTATLDAYGNLSVTVKKTFNGDIELYVSCDNILSEKIETQPGYVRNAPVLYSGLNVKL